MENFVAPRKIKNGRRRKKDVNKSQLNLKSLSDISNGNRLLAHHVNVGCSEDSPNDNTLNDVNDDILDTDCFEEDLNINSTDKICSIIKCNVCNSDIEQNAASNHYLICLKSKFGLQSSKSPLVDVKRSTGNLNLISSKYFSSSTEKIIE